jgi:AraC-like DNA-binding protein
MLGSLDEVGTYVELRPPPALRSRVECLWVHDIDDPPPPGGRRLLPSGRVDLVWMEQLGVRVAGPQSRFLRPPPVDRMLVFGARLRPGVAPYLLRTPASELADRHTRLDAIDPRLAARLHDRLLDAPDPAAVVRALGEELERSLRSVDAPDPAVREAVRLLDRGESVACAAERAFVSERALQRRFLQDVGYSPKTLQRVLRFQRFLRLLPRVSLARAALAAGYADQAHVSREARRLSGLSPRQLVDFSH